MKCEAIVKILVDVAQKDSDGCPYSNNADTASAMEDTRWAVTQLFSELPQVQGDFGDSVITLESATVVNVLTALDS